MNERDFTHDRWAAALRAMRIADGLMDIPEAPAEVQFESLELAVEHDARWALTLADVQSLLEVQS